ncbi:hypothetical protein BU17DRAFT_72420 [Hysterangium stoloniferum]|nr:hypothetical protein BU17DRAFT_72420 [Hysterangium stoloniferum]
MQRGDVGTLGSWGKEEWIKKLVQRSREGLEKISDQVELLLFECGKGITMEMGVQYNMQFSARLGSGLHGTICDFVTLLKDSDENIQSCGLSALEKLSEQGAVGEFPTATANAILDLVALLKDSDRYGQSSRVLALAKFSEQGADSDEDVRSGGVLALGKFSEHSTVGDDWIGIQLTFDTAKFRKAIAGAIPDIVALLKQSDEDVRSYVYPPPQARPRSHMALKGMSSPFK